MQLDDLLAQTRLVTVKYGDAELNIEYFRQRLWDAEGTRLIAAMQKHGEANDEAMAVLCQILSRLISWWDLYESEGVPLTANVEALGKLPISVLLDVSTAIFNNESKPNPPTITVNADVPR